MQETTGRVTVNEKNPSGRFQRFVDDKIHSWLVLHEMEDKQPDYRVSFFNEDILGEISCLVTIQVGDQQWRGWQTAENARNALNGSILNLQLDIQH